MREPIKFGKYYLVERIAVGGMAEVFKAVTYGVEGFERRVALKRVLPDIAEDKEFTTMFIDEANIAVQLSHANISQIFELGNTDGSLFIAMEYVQGMDLRVVWDRARKRQEHLSIPMCCHVIKEVCEALEYAHSKRNENHEPLNLVHRDISPQNIILSYDGETKLIDFGIAKASGKETKTQAGILKGKFGYMSPEQVRGRPIDRRSDLFSLAVVLYELLTLERCFQGESDFSTLEKVRNVDIRKPSAINRNIPPELERILMKGLERNPEDRYQNASEFGEALQRFLYQTGNFYGRKDLSSYMRQTFEKEFLADQRRNAEFREYAKQHIPEARRNSSHEDDTSTDIANADTESFQVQNPDLNWDDDELSTAIWNRSPHTGESAQPTQPPQLPPQTPPPISPSMSAHPVLPPTIQQPAVREEANSHRGIILFSALAITAVICVAVYLLFSNPLSSSLVVTVNPPNAQWTIDGQPQALGPYPLTISNLEDGKHVLTAQAEGYQSYESTIELSYNEIRQHEITLSQMIIAASLYVPSNPQGAKLSIDGQEVGFTPIEVPNLPQGNHLLKLEKAGYIEWTSTIPVQATGQQKLNEIQLFPEFIEVDFITEPKQAELTLVQENHRQPLGKGNIHLPALRNDGRAKIVASAAGFISLERDIPQTTEHKLSETLTLTPNPASSTQTAANTVRRNPQQRGHKPHQETSAPAPAPAPAPAQPVATGSFKLISTPAANVFIDNKDIGWTPIRGYKLSAGVHTVRLVNKDQQLDDRFTIEIQAGETLFKKYTR